MKIGYSLQRCQSLLAPDHLKMLRLIIAGRRHYTPRLQNPVQLLLLDGTRVKNDPNTCSSPIPRNPWFIPPCKDIVLHPLAKIYIQDYNNDIDYYKYEIL